MLYKFFLHTTIGISHDRRTINFIFMNRHICQSIFIIRGFLFQRFLREKINIQRHFWVFDNDSLGINYVDSYDGGLPFWTKSWPTGETCNFKNITSGTDRNEEIFQVVNKGGRSFEKFIYTCAFSGTLVPKRSISSISSRVVMVSKNYRQGLPL